MSARADAIREKRWREEGNARLTMRISGAADRVIDHLASIHRCSRRDVIEGLLLGTITKNQIPTAVSQAMREHGLSYSEAIEFTGSRA